MLGLMYLAFPLATLAVPSPVDPVRILLRRGEPVFYIVENGCANYSKMLTAVKAARQLATVAVREWWDLGQEAEAAAQYLNINIADGEDYKKNEFVQTVANNLRRVANLEEAIPYYGEHIHVLCTDKYNECRPRNGGVTTGYAKNPPEVNAYEIILCPVWMTMSTPDEQYEMYQNDKKEGAAMNWLSTDVGAVLHEMMHIDLITQSPTSPHIIDQMSNGKKMYGAAAIADWIRDDHPSTENVISNADSYNQFVQAIYFKSRFGFLPPPASIVAFKETIECAGNPNEYIDSTILDRYGPDFCTEVTTKYKAGTQGSFGQTFAKGTPSEFNLELSWSDRATFSNDAVDQQCLDAIGRTTHNCDTASRWKSGGYYTISDGEDDVFTYLVKPNKERPPVPTALPATCKVAYKFLYNSFWIKGGGWADDEERRDLLAANVRRCGAVTAWRFDWYGVGGGSEGMEWEAYGRLPVWMGTWNCVAKAVVDSGGRADVECT
ncbi:hypothetical protein EG328_010012 [Venturia inaequalis]|uniref:Lysine-specific metallo-endopeptidase domain-containing protein n=1 Tax=Venturia inaequalis TaxID=5025 RepID=A0A8H3V7B1_VENIN|nr:hypothetical protein EG328_010012 [Venturia inaequalis]